MAAPPPDVYNFPGFRICQCALKASTNRNREGRLTMIQNRPVLKHAEMGFAEMNSVRIIRGISTIEECNPILIVL